MKANLQVAWGGAPDATLVGVNIVSLVILWLLRGKLPSAEALERTHADALVSTAVGLVSPAASSHLPDTNVVRG